MLMLTVAFLDNILERSLKYYVLRVYIRTFLFLIIYTDMDMFDVHICLYER
jgi:hypothetical protein